MLPPGDKTKIKENELNFQEEEKLRRNKKKQHFGRGKANG